MPLQIPIADVPSQRFATQLAGQNCTVTITTKSTGLFLDLEVNNEPVISGVVCENLNRIVRSLYLGFSGDLSFYDTQATDDPSWPGLGTRYLLLYYTAVELGGLG